MKERITSQEYMWLTQANLEDEAQRSFFKKVAGYGDLETLFTEWTDEQKSAWEEEHNIEEEQQ
jgi:hypothetical protein